MACSYYQHSIHRCNAVQEPEREKILVVLYTSQLMVNGDGFIHARQQSAKVEVGGSFVKILSTFQLMEIVLQFSSLSQLPIRFIFHHFLFYHLTVYYKMIGYYRKVRLLN